MATAERKIKGFGTKAGGKKLMHIVCEDDGALCDKRLSGFGKVSTVLTNVTCPKCESSGIYKQLIVAFSIGDSLQEIKAVLEETDAVKKAKQKEQQTEKKPDPGKPETGAPPAPKKKPSAKKKEPVYPPKGPTEKKGKEKEKVPELPLKKEDWGLLWAKDKLTCDILHKPSQKVLFTNIKSNIALAALIKLNEMRIIWASGQATIPKSFISTIKTIVGKAYKKTGNKIPPNLVKISKATKKKEKDKKEKPQAKRTIKRRGEKVEKEKVRVIKRRTPDKKETRVIKRRDKKDAHIITETFGRREGTPGFTIIQLLNEGTSIQNMVKELVKKHSLTEQKAKTKIKGVIRKTARKKGIPIVIKLMKNEGEDIYGLYGAI